MSDTKNSEGGQSTPPEKSNGKYREDTPTFIRDVQTRADLLHPERTNAEVIPVLAMPRSVKIWRRIRWPFFVITVVFVLGIVAYITQDVIVARSIRKTISDAQSAEERGTIQGIQAASQTLSALARRHPSHSIAQSAWAWQAIIHARFLGPEAQMMKNAETAFENTGDDGSPAYLAAKTVLRSLKGKHDEALRLLIDGEKLFPKEPRLKLARAWIYWEAGKTHEAREVFRKEIQAESPYIPFHMASLEFELSEGNTSDALELHEKLLSLSPGHLYGTLIQIALMSPNWGESPPDSQRIDILIDRVTELKDILAKAPPKLAVLGYFLSGQVFYMAKDYDRAIQQLHRVMEIDPNAETLAYLALAKASLDDPDEALKLLDTHADLSGPEILDVRARCLLDYHRVSEASEVIRDLESTKKLSGRVRELKWILAVRSGETTQAVELLPGEIRKIHDLIAAELYFILKQSGDAEGISKLRTSMHKHLKPCSVAISLWHSNDVQKAIEALRNPPADRISCRDALSLRLLRKHVSPAKMKSIADRVQQSKNKNLIIEIDRALTIWLTDGYRAALQILDRVWDAKPQGAPIQYALGKAYIEMDKPQKALDILKNNPTPEAISLKIQAAGALKTADALVAKLEKQAVQSNQKSFHPALAAHNLNKQLAAKTLNNVATQIEPLLSGAGQWTDEIAQIGAKTLLIAGNWTDADKFLATATRTALKESGLDEAWEIRLLQVNFAIRRGGKFMYRATHLLDSLKADGVKDPTVYYNYARAHLAENNERFGIRLLRDALALDPTYKPAYTKLAAMDRLDEELIAQIERFRPELKHQNNVIAGFESPNTRNKTDAGVSSLP